MSTSRWKQDLSESLQHEYNTVSSSMNFVLSVTVAGAQQEAT